MKRGTHEIDERFLRTYDTSYMQDSKKRKVTWRKREREREREREGMKEKKE